MANAHLKLTARLADLSIVKPLSLSNRFFHTTQKLAGAPHGEDPVKNFEDFKYPNQVSTFEHYRLPDALLDYEYNYPVCRDTMGIRWPGYWFKRRFVYVKEMEPELVVPDLEGFDLKPYVSHRTEERTVGEFTAKNLFDAIYLRQLTQDFEEGKEFKVSPEEIDEARLKAMQTGADLFEESPIDGVRAPPDYTKEFV